MQIIQTKNNIANPMQLYAFTQKKKKKAVNETVKIKQTKTIITKLL